MDPITHILLNQCLPPLAQNASEVIQKCKSYVRPGVNVSELATRPPDGYFKVKDRNFRRIGRSVSRCTRSFKYDYFALMDGKMRFCLFTLSYFMDDAIMRCAAYSFPRSQKALPCFKRILERSKQMKSGGQCEMIRTLKLLKRKKYQVKRYARLTKVSKDGCFYGYNDVLSEPSFRCLNAAVGIAQHVIDACLDWLHPLRDPQTTPPS